LLFYNPRLNLRKLSHSGVPARSVYRRSHPQHSKYRKKTTEWWNPAGELNALPTPPPLSAVWASDGAAFPITPLWKPYFAPD